MYLFPSILEHLTEGKNTIICCNFKKFGPVIVTKLSTAGWEAKTACMNIAEKSWYNTFRDFWNGLKGWCSSFPTGPFDFFYIYIIITTFFAEKQREKNRRKDVIEDQPKKSFLLPRSRCVFNSQP